MKAKADLPYLEWTEPDSGAIKRIYADVITDESANLAAVVTQHAVEKGAKITDHYRKEPETVSVVYLFSGAPLRGDLDDENAGSASQVQLTYPNSRAQRRAARTALNYPPGPGPSLALLNPLNALSAGLSALGVGALPKEVQPSPDDRSANKTAAVQALTFASDPAKRFERVLETIRRLQTQGILVTVKTTFGPFPNCGIINAALKRTPDMGTSGEITFSLEQLNFVSSDIALALPIPQEPRAIPKKTASAAGAGAVDPNSQEETVAKKAAVDFFGLTPGGSL